MPDLKQRQQKFQQKRKQTPWRGFLMQIASWKPITFHKVGQTLSMYAPGARVAHVVDPELFAQQRDRLPSKEIGSADLFSIFGDLWNDIPLPGRLHFGGLENAAFTTTSVNSRNCYLAYNTSNVEDVAYAVSVKAYSAHVFNSVMVYDHCASVAYSYAVFNGFNVFYSRYIHHCHDIWFSSNLINCQECLLCSDLENQSYCIRNEQYDKETYMEKKKELLMQKDQFMNWYGQVDRRGTNFGSEESEGSCLINCNSITQAHSVYNVAQGRNIYMSGEELDNEHIYDACFIGALGGNHYYGVVDVAGSEHVYCSSLILGSAYVYYSYYLQNCSYCLGCIGLQNKQFCIFNKQYTKEERLEQVDEIFQKMEDDGNLGDFFPATLNPYYFNDTVAYMLDPGFIKEEVEGEGYLRRDEEVKVDIPEGVEVISVEDLDKYQGWMIDGEFVSLHKSPHLQQASGTPLNKGGQAPQVSGGIRSTDPTILKKVIQDDQGNVYRIIPMEFEFLQKHGLPLPRLHWLERLKMNFRIT